MKAEWYGDKRDLVKWGSLLHLARDHSIELILQVMYRRATTWPTLEIDGRERDLPEEVIHHFRELTKISCMTGHPRIDVISSTFDDRQTYMREILEHLAIPRRSEDHWLVFLDPDTGLEPGKPRPEHVLKSEVREIWERIRAGDILALYQHQTNRKGLPWIEQKREELEEALGLRSCAAKVASGPRLAPDVVLFYCCKGLAESTRITQA